MVPKAWFGWVIGFLFLFLFLSASSAQSPRFTTATIRSNTSPPADRPVSRVTDDGGYLATNVTLKRLIEDAYRRFGFDRREVIGGPDWIATERFDVVAQGAGLHPDGDGFPRESLRMLQELLKERFQIWPA